jgi:hypothetical protein
VRTKRIPGAEAWRGYQSDPDAKRAHALFFGKSIEEVIDLFRGGQCIQRAQELRFMPRGAFRYYVHAFGSYVTSQEPLDSLEARVFLGLLQSREELDPESVSEIYAELSASIEFIASQEERFYAQDLDGSFGDLVKKVRALSAPPRSP